MIRKIFFIMCVILAFLLVLTSARGIAAPLQSENTSFHASEASSYTQQHLIASKCPIAPAFEISTAAHHLQMITDIAEYSETEKEEDDDVSAHLLITTALYLLHLPASCFSNASPGGLASYSVPLCILHHCWKYFPALA